MVSSPKEAKAALIRLIQNAHAGELAAMQAYYGHAHSLFITSTQERLEILKIRDEERHHRDGLKSALSGLGAKPRLLREALMWCVGSVIAILSFFGTWFIPMYGAGLLEKSNIGEYEVAARLAFLSEEESLIETLLQYAEVEWDHERHFRKKVGSHFLSKWIPIWSEPAPKANIRKSFASFKAAKRIPCE